MFFNDEMEVLWIWIPIVKEPGFQWNGIRVNRWLVGGLGWCFSVWNRRNIPLHEDRITHPETNVEPEKRPSQKEISSSNHPFSGPLLVSGRVTSLLGQRFVFHNQTPAVFHLTFFFHVFLVDLWRSKKMPWTFGFVYLLSQMLHGNIYLHFPVFMWPCFTTCRYIYIYIIHSVYLGYGFPHNKKTGWLFEICFIFNPTWEMIHFYHSQQRMDPNLKNRWKRLKILIQKAPCKDINNI